LVIKNPENWQALTLRITVRSSKFLNLSIISMALWMYIFFGINILKTVMARVPRVHFGGSKIKFCGVSPILNQFRDKYV
jgi:hypothetical protein